jgi:hypothetical protein
MIVVYEDEDGMRLSVEHKGRGKPPRFIHESGVRYDLAYEGYDPQTDELGLGVTVAAATRPSQRDGRFIAWQRPRWDRFHKGEFTKDGKPLMTSRREAHEVASRETGETGLDVRYNEL